MAEATTTQTKTMRHYGAALSAVALAGSPASAVIVNLSITPGSEVVPNLGQVAVIV